MQVPAQVFRKTIRETMLKIVELNENVIGAEMKNTKGAIVYDGLSKRFVHFVGLYAVYMKSHGNKGYGTENTKELAMPLLSASPIAQAPSTISVFDKDDDIEDVNRDKVKDNEATTFDPETHISHMTDVFGNYGFNLTR